MFWAFFIENTTLLIIVSVITLVSIITSLVVIPLVILNLSKEYFDQEGGAIYHYRLPIIRFVVIILKNILGYILILFGVLMLFIPGQGLLSIALGIFFINFPGKKRVEQKFFSNHKVNTIINVIRRKFGREELLL